ncbi:MAG: hypothetical protein WAQ28_20695 [Bacteroidia bacterium]
MRKCILFFLSLTILASCSQNNPVENTATESVNSTESSVAKEVELEGLYADHYLVNCSDNARIAVTGLISNLDSLYKGLLPEAYSGQTIYVKLKGQLTNNELSVKEVVQAEQKNDKNTCIPYDYWCMGNEPFWRVQVSEKENLIDFFDPMASTYYHFNFTKPEVKQGITVYTTESGKNKIKITITSENCSDGMSERSYQYKAGALLNGTTYKGCAVSSLKK